MESAAEPSEGISDVSFTEPASGPSAEIVDGSSTEPDAGSSVKTSPESSIAYSDRISADISEAFSEEIFSGSAGERSCAHGISDAAARAVDGIISAARTAASTAATSKLRPFFFFISTSQPGSTGINVYEALRNTQGIIWKDLTCKLLTCI